MDSIVPADQSFYMNKNQFNTLNVQVEAFNKTLNEGRVTKKELDKDDFLKILLTQLTHQDPTKPLEDKEFVAQMAQFSTLEQITNMNREITSVVEVLSRNNAFGILGKTVEIQDGEDLVRGMVEKVIGGENPQVQVQGKLYDYNDVASVTMLKEASL